jgi:hypothetical protein
VNYPEGPAGFGDGSVFSSFQWGVGRQEGIGFSLNV